MGLKRNLKQQSLEVYDSIFNLPQWNWEQIHKTNNLSYLKVLTTYRKVEVDTSNELQELWEEIYEEYIEEFGFSNSYNDLINSKIYIAGLKHEYIKTSNRVLLNVIRIAENKLSKEGAGEALNLLEAVQHIEKHQGIKLNSRTITVADYHAYIKTISKNGR